MATIAVRSPARPTPGPIARVGNAVWGLLTSVDFAVVQIIVLGLLAVVGMTLHQLPDFAFRSATDYANEMDKLHATYDPVLGTGVVAALERLQLFHVFSSIWFSVGLVVLILSIVACTIDRTPRLWRQSAEIRVIQPDPFYDPTLPERAVVTGLDADAVERVLRRNRFRVRREAVGAISYLYGDRNRWTKLATLLTHTGLVLFLVAAAVTTRFGDEQGLVVADGESLTVQPIGTPGLLLVRNLGFEAPGFSTGHPTDFTTHLAVYQDGRQIADKVIRVNDPLTVAGYTFHQNGFGPAPDVVIRDQSGKPLWSGPVPMTDQAAGFPYADFAVPGRAVALQMLLQRQPDGTGLLVVLPYESTGTNADGSDQVQGLQPVALAEGEATVPPGTDFSVELRGFSDYTLLIAKRDPGQGIVWAAFLCLIAGIVITFWMPRRRIWGRLDADGRLAMVVRVDRYVDVTREFGRVLTDLVAARHPGSAAPDTSATRDTPPTSETSLSSDSPLTPESSPPPPPPPPRE
jgi:cytochrome c biogenesis protein